jgi:hypothetical protein
MSRGRKGSFQNGNPKLSFVGKQEVIELLKLADKSTHPEIREIAARIAEQDSEHLRNRESKVSPSLVLIVATLVLIAAAAASWIAIVAHPGAVGLEITGTIAAFLMIAIGVYLRLSGHLTRADFLQMMGMVWDWFKKISSGASEPTIPKPEAKPESVKPADTGSTPHAD